MTTIPIRPIQKWPEWDLSDSSTYDNYLRDDWVVSSSTLPSPNMVVSVGDRWEPEVEANHWRELQRWTWFAPTIRAMAVLPWLTDNWTTGGRRTQPSAVDGMLAILVRVLDRRTPPPRVVPTWRGGVQVEWHCSGVDLEIEADPQGGVEYFFSSPNEEREGRAWGDLGQLAKYVEAVTASV